MAEIPEMTVQELKALMDSGAQDYVLVDVRNPNEYEIARIPGSVLVPLSEIENGPGVEKIRSLLNGHRLLVHCKMGGPLPKRWASSKRLALRESISKGASTLGVRKSTPAYPPTNPRLGAGRRKGMLRYMNFLEEKHALSRAIAALPRITT
uniref:Uncharacterized 16.5 kDa protein in psaL 5'region n=1 Tax=Synechococcus elongatus TaxID=32046 RepID=YPSL_SYNEL|nr:RecName: Full=Uncharacterized 16.5 kDa protein in psaL 5'region [Synechococcus elongatus]CAA45295.1 unnamed protein product [Synechococcus sp.]